MSLYEALLLDPWKKLMVDAPRGVDSMRHAVESGRILAKDAEYLERISWMKAAKRERFRLSTRRQFLS